MKILLLFVLASAFAPKGWAQYLEKSVISSAGAHHSEPSPGNLHWTLGEIAVEEFQNIRVLTQGFHQGYIDVVLGIGQEQETDAHEIITIFPNPTRDEVTLITDLPGPLEITLTDLLGRQVFSQKAMMTNELVNLRLLPSGVYMLRVRRKGQPVGNFRIQKADS